MEFTFPTTKKTIHITQAFLEGWSEHITYVATPYRTLIGLAEYPESVNADCPRLFMVAQLIGQPHAMPTAQGIGIQAQHLVIPYEGAGYIPELRLHSYDYAFRLRDIDERGQTPSWTDQMLVQYAAPLDRSGIVLGAPKLDLTKIEGLNLK